jgi:autotransporter-associated beta strand protein
VNTNAILDISQVNYAYTVSFGSVEGSGAIDLGASKIQIGSLNSNSTISGLISDAGPGGQTGGSLDKVGAGTLTLLNSNTYTGGTTIDAGALAIEGSIQGSTEIRSGATLKGTGTIYGIVTVDPGGILAPGNSPGTITMESLRLTNSSVLDFELGTTSDKVVVTTSGGLTLDGILNISDSGGFNTNAPYVLFNYTGTVTNDGLQFGTVPAGYLPSDFSLSVTNGQVEVIAVPEPSIYSLFGIGAVGILILLRRKKSALKLVLYSKTHLLLEGATRMYYWLRCPI